MGCKHNWGARTHYEYILGGKIMFNTPFTMPVAPAYANNGGLGGFGNDWIGLIVILAILGWFK